MDNPINAAVQMLDKGLSCIPCDPASKRPPITWKPYQSKLMDLKDATSMQWPGVAIIAGTISGNTEVLDFDFKAAWYDLWAELVDAEVPGLTGKLLTQTTQSGGKHVVYRCPGIDLPGNQELAHDLIEVAGPGDHNHHGKTLRARQTGNKWHIAPCLIETRCNGGYFLAAPTPGYKVQNGHSFLALPGITSTERDILIKAAKALNRYVRTTHDPQPRTIAGDRPGDDYNTHADIRTLLERHGWKQDRTQGDYEYWTRPGKERGISASLINGQVFRVFTSNAPPFEPDQAYSKFSVYAHLEHVGNFEEAARALRSEGYGGSNTKTDTPPSTDIPPPDQQVPPSNLKFRLIKASDLACRPPVWIVRDCIEDNTLAVIFGDSGSGKSFLGIDISCCVATGKDFIGHAVKSSGPVAYILGEGGNGFARRLRAWSIRHQINIKDIPLYASNQPAALCTPSSVADVTRAIDEVAKATSPRLIVIDTLARNFGPGDENSTQDMTRFIQAADIIRTRYQCSILIIHHTGHAFKDRERGASPLRGAIDASYRLDKDESGVVRFTPIKMKEAELPEPMAFQIRSVDLGFQDDEGREVTSAILDPIPYEAPAPSKKGRGKNQGKAMDILKRIFSERKGNLTKGGFDPDNARVTINEWRDACLDSDIHKSSFSKLKTSLADHGHITVNNNFVEIIR